MTSKDSSIKQRTYHWCISVFIATNHMIPIVRLIVHSDLFHRTRLRIHRSKRMCVSMKHDIGRIVKKEMSAHLSLYSSKSVVYTTSYNTYAHFLLESWIIEQPKSVAQRIIRWFLIKRRITKYVNIDHYSVLLHIFNVVFCFNVMCSICYCFSWCFLIPPLYHSLKCKDQLDRQIAK
jgi:hypothetical protein